eukprot:scaffold7371_cov121-Isochrysis_galbana.AAC.8
MVDDAPHARGTELCRGLVHIVKALARHELTKHGRARQCEGRPRQQRRRGASRRARQQGACGGHQAIRRAPVEDDRRTEQARERKRRQPGPRGNAAYLLVHGRRRPKTGSGRERV